jgi:predicted nucleic acid-binding protein
MHRLTDEECLEFIRSLHDASEVVALGDPPADGISLDPDDDPVIQTAIEGKADVLCTLDRHLRTQNVQDYCQLHGIRVLTDVEFLDELRRLDSLSDESK